MKVLLVNGSPHQQGCTYTALAEIEKTLKEEGIHSEFFWVGNHPTRGCLGCKKCVSLGKCVFDDRVNEFLAVADQYDGYIFGSPVHYAAMAGGMKPFMDRVFYSGHSSGKNPFLLKPVAAVVSARRAGTTAALDEMYKYFYGAQMPIVTSNYWNMVHGSTPEEVKKDEEGLQIMRILGRNMAWLLKCKEAGEKAGIPAPKQEEKIKTSFIR